MGGPTLETIVESDLSHDLLVFLFLERIRAIGVEEMMADTVKSVIMEAWDALPLVQDIVRVMVDENLVGSIQI